MDWNCRDNGTIHLYGHVHNKNIAGMKEYFADKLAFNVCMDVNNFEPKTLDELYELAKALTKRDASGKITRSGFQPRYLGGGDGVNGKFIPYLHNFGARVL